MKWFAHQIRMLHITRTQNGPNQFDQAFLGSITTFLRVCQLFCAAPLTLKLIPEPLDHITTWRERLFRLLHCVWCLTVLLIIIATTYFQYMEFDSNVLSFLTRILYTGEYISGMLNSTIIIAGCHYQRQHYANYFRRLIAIDWRIHTSGGKVCYVTTRKFLRRMLHGYLGFVIIVILTDFMYNQREAKGFFRSTTVYSLPNAISMLALSEYFFLLFCLRQRYHHVIEILLTLPMGQPWLSEPTPMNGKINWTGGTWQKVTMPEKTMEIMRQVCLDLTELYTEINESFGVLVITTVVSSFLILSIQFYALYTFVEDLQEDNIWLTIYTILWIILHGGKAFLILYYNDAVNKQVISLEIKLARILVLIHIF